MTTTYTMDDIRGLLGRAMGERDDEDLEDGSGLAALSSAIHNWDHASMDYSDWDGHIIGGPAKVTEKMDDEAGYLDGAIDDLEAAWGAHSAMEGHEAQQRVESNARDLAAAIQAATDAWIAANPEMASV